MVFSILKDMVDSDENLSYLSMKIPNGFKSLLFLRDDDLEVVKLTFKSLPEPVVSCKRSSDRWVFDVIDVEDIEKNLIDGTAHLYFFEFGNLALMYFDAAEGTVVLLISEDIVDQVRGVYGDAASPGSQREVLDELINNTSGAYRDKALILRGAI